MLCFLVFRCSIFKVPFTTALCDSLFSISYSVPFVKGFLNFFQVSFRHFRPLKVTISCSFSHTPCLPCLSGTGSLAELYYITTFFPFCQPLFYLFFPFFPLFLPFLFDVSSFLSLFSRFFGVLWVFVGRDGCGAMIRSMQNLGTFLKEKSTRKVLPRQGHTSCLSGSSRKGNVFTFFLLLQKEPKSSRDSVLRPRFKTLWKNIFRGISCIRP